MAKWIDFDLNVGLSTGKTKVWNVYAKGGGNVLLGQVEWFGRWRKYAFHAALCTVFEADCLRDIAMFCEEQSKLFWSEKRKAKSAA